MNRPNPKKTGDFVVVYLLGANNGSWTEIEQSWDWFSRHLPTKKHEQSSGFGREYEEVS